MAFLYHDNSESIQTPQTDDPFVYQNYLYSILCGHPVSLYRPLSYTCSSKGDSDSGTDQVYTLSVPEGNYALYGNIPWDSPMENASLNVNDSYISRYSWWLSPSAFYIPAASEAAYQKFPSIQTMDISSGMGANSFTRWIWMPLPLFPRRFQAELWKSSSWKTGMFPFPVLLLIPAPCFIYPSLTTKAGKYTETASRLLPAFWMTACILFL